MNYKPLALKCLLFFISAFTCEKIIAQDTTRVTIQDAEKQFLEKNLQLLAEKYNIDISRANVIQARLYNNPNFSVS
ncbi:MAG TPA: hypothetical protein VKI61_12460, partial [Chitinophagaceae bacterium]|nr:hypothetical protein [Chitinophagaceae bacterium]